MPAPSMVINSRRGGTGAATAAALAAPAPPDPEAVGERDRRE
jgi:hypothetical protein